MTLYKKRMPKEEKHVQVAIRMPLSMRKAIQKEADGLSQKAGLRATVSDVIRAFIRRGLEGETQRGASK